MICRKEKHKKKIDFEPLDPLISSLIKPKSKSIFLVFDASTATVDILHSPSRAHLVVSTILVFNVLGLNRLHSASHRH